MSSWLIVSALNGFGGSALGQDGTPATALDVPLAEECTVNAVELSSLANLIGAEPEGSSSLLMATPVPEADLPTGPDAIEEEIDAITATVRELVACANAAEPFRILALISDDFKSVLAGVALTATEEDAQDLLGRFPVPIGGVDPSQPLQMIPIRDARLLPDGRVGAILEPVVTGLEQVEADFFVIFEEGDDRWLVDDVLLLETGIFATPAARVS